jgi:hypothetical protein
MAMRHEYTLLCESILYGPEGLFTVYNIFNNIVLNEFPGSVDRMYVVVGVTSEPGDRMEITIGSAQEEEALFRAEAEVPQRSDPLQPFEQERRMLFFDAATVEYPRPGIYYVVARSDNLILHRQPFGVLQAVEREEAADDSSA